MIGEKIMMKGGAVLTEPFQKGEVAVRLGDADTGVVALDEGSTRFGDADPTREMGDMVEEVEHGFLEVEDGESLSSVVGEEIEGSDVVELEEQVHGAEVPLTVFVSAWGCRNHR